MRSYLFLCIIIVFVCCSIEPAKIDYGKDACHFCKMNIVERTHAAQLVTKKGKAFKYDAIECMLNDLEHKDQEKIKLFLITDYLKPESLIDAQKATFLISDSIQSPMGANLTGFETEKDASAIVNEKGNGKTYNWQGVQRLFYNQ